MLFSFEARLRQAMRKTFCVALFSLWSVAPPARGAGGIPTSPLCPPGPPIPPSNGRGYPPDPPCTAAGTFLCPWAAGAVTGSTWGFGLRPPPIGSRNGYALFTVPSSRRISPQKSLWQRPLAAAPRISRSPCAGEVSFFQKPSRSLRDFMAASQISFLPWGRTLRYIFYTAVKVYKLFRQSKAKSP